MTEKTAEPEINWDELRPQVIKMALELGPLVTFFIANARGEAILDGSATLSGWFGGQAIVFATAVFMAAMLISLVLTWFILKKIAIMPLVTGVVVLVFGGLTLYFRDPAFIMIKPTITNGLFAATLLGGLIFKQSLLKYVFGDVYKLREEGWSKLTLNWGLFFVLLAVINEVLWRNFSSDVWINFKVWGVMPLTVIFSISQVSLLNKYAPAAEPKHVPPIVVES
ncbi:intracellular septation protein [Devosia sp. YR412]|uniref:septation protein A n=1 Tax=Devosia sp. YR412 TaxID=1881030 RepID=UPI0008BBF55F|nr:septation protein A [Devosia sp. YR412]SEQ25053.1 intracellular septation protein [Devosia sp. YR412]